MRISKQKKNILVFFVNFRFMLNYNSLFFHHKFALMRRFYVLALIFLLFFVLFSLGILYCSGYAHIIMLMLWEKNTFHYRPFSVSSFRSFLFFNLLALISILFHRCHLALFLCSVPTKIIKSAHWGRKSFGTISLRDNLQTFTISINFEINK